ncbi:S8 family serine peptidase [Streptomyces sp. NPDC051940]|uniref:S8 family serine peptidase n=1 Tax=Streptomyces sp. NPDC051940 TaxID=3155675 RepID=UPI00342638E3
MSLPFLAATPAAAGAPEEPTALRQKAEASVRRQLAAQDRATFWVQLATEADTSAAAEARSKAGKGRAVIEAKTRHADRTQAGLRALLKKEGARYTAFWISNSLEVTADKALAEKIAARPEVASLEADDPIELPAPAPGEDQPTTDAVGWNIDRVGAPRVWGELGKRGEGVVVANIDSGVDYKHPALSGSYRGLGADGSYDHDYNWFDPANVCAGDDPCDNEGHGTHTMGTMVGDDGAGNRIGVAPGAKWIAAKGCEGDTCTRASLMASGQWILAPTDSSGANPRPDLAPDVVNNSWGLSTLDVWYRETVQAWRDAGIFASFSNGNAGPGCNTAGSPGGYNNAYSSGAFGADGRIANFSSRGSGEAGGVKPNIAAPGIDIRSAVPGGGYQSMNGTSMAAPHTAGTAALMWSASPAIRGDVAATEALLNATAIDTFDPTCGGTAANNNVWGQGRLDAYAAVMATPRGPLGALSGAVTAGGQPLADALVGLDGPMTASVRTRQDGTYALSKVMAGDYTVTVSKYGYLTEKKTVTVVEDHTATTDADLATAPVGTLSGTVRIKGSPEAGAKVDVSGTPASATTGAYGGYSLQLPLGAYQLAVTPGGNCAEPVIVTVEVAADTTAKDVDLAVRSDTFGTTCRPVDAPFPTAQTRLGLSGAAGTATVNLPFPVALYGRTYTSASVSVEGALAFGASSTTSINMELPIELAPNGALYPFWDNLLMDNSSGVYTSFRGTAPHREFVVEWRNMILSDNKPQRLGFAAVISEDGGYTFHYRGIEDGAAERGGSATIGAENHEGTEAFQYSRDEPVLRDGMVLEFRPEKTASVSGVATDANDGLPLAGAKVTVTRDGAAVATGTTGADGAYLVQVPAAKDPAAYRIEITAAHYESASRTATLAGGAVSREDSALHTGRVTADPAGGWTLVIPSGESRQRTLTLHNTGSATDYTVTEASGAGWLTVDPAAGRLAAGEQRDIALTFDASDAAPGSVLRGTVKVVSESGRKPVTEIPVTVAVPAYRTAVDAGSETSATDASGDVWGPDRAYTEGSYGYLGRTGTVQTNKTVAGTGEQELFRTANQGPYEYRFDGLPDGVYEVELGFAEITGAKAGTRLFDVMAEDVEKIRNLDIALAAGGSYRALTRTFTVEVVDGQLNLRFPSAADKPLVNWIRVTHRPDLAG